MSNSCQINLHFYHDINHHLDDPNPILWNLYQYTLLKKLPMAVIPTSEIFQYISITAPLTIDFIFKKIIWSTSYQSVGARNT